MKTPIFDYIVQYAQRNPLRLHMPGHKGEGSDPFTALDITEITGADDLYHPDGIIAQSEENASALFGCPTIYSTEGSSQCIRAMLALALMNAPAGAKIAAGRNAHKTFLTAAALLDFGVDWLYPAGPANLLSCPLTPADIVQYLQKTSEKPAAIYLTSPDYLGNLADIAGISAVCRAENILLLVDNAHGAYLKFLPGSRHPMEQGADLCCDSAHKTLPVLTGGAYLHIAPGRPDLCARAKDAMALFGSTSPSYLILRSLDLANRYLAEEAPAALAETVRQIAQTKARLSSAGWQFTGDEPMKLTISARKMGYTGTELAEMLEKQDIFPEFADPDYLVLMPAPATGAEGMARLEEALLALPARPPMVEKAGIYHHLLRLPAGDRPVCDPDRYAGGRR